MPVSLLQRQQQLARWRALLAQDSTAAEHLAPALLTAVEHLLDESRTARVDALREAAQVLAKRLSDVAAFNQGAACSVCRDAEAHAFLAALEKGLESSS